MNSLQVGICQIVIGPLMNVSLRFYFVVVRQTVHFMDENLKVDVWIHFVGSGHSEIQPPESLHVVILTTEETNSSTGKKVTC